MDLRTSLVLELKLTFTVKEEELVDRVADELRDEFERLGLEESTVVSTGSEDGGTYTTTIFVPVRDGQQIIAQLPELIALQSRLHAVFLATSRPAPNNPGTLH